MALSRDFIATGVPGWRHDWTWPIAHASAQSILSFGLSPWVPIDVGGAQLYPSLVPLLVAEAILNAILSPAGALVILLCSLLSLCGVGAYALCRAMQLSRGASFAAGIFYMSAPAIYDNVIAGHLGDLCVYAGLPLFVYGVVTARNAFSYRTIAVACIGALIASIQLQGFALVVLCAVFIAVAAWRARSTAVATAGVGCMILANLNSFVGLASDANAERILRQNHAVLSWVSVQSTNLSEAFSGRGYFTSYDRLSLAFGDDIALVVCATLVALAIYGWRRRETLSAGFIALYLCGVAMVSGLKGPFVSAWTWLFVHVSATSLFRELFHAAPLIALPMAVGLGVIVQSSMAGFASRRYATATVVGAVAAIALAVNALPAASGTSQWLRSYTISPIQHRLYSMLKADPRGDRYTFFPGRQPYKLDDQTEGVDAGNYYPIDGHAPIFGYFPYGPLAYASDRLASGDDRAAYVMYERLSLRYVLFRRSPRPALAESIAPEDRLPGVNYHERRAARDAIVTLPADPHVRVGRVPLVMGGGFEELERIPVTRIVAFAQLQPSFVKAAPRYYEVDRKLAGVDEALAAGCMSMRRPLPSVVTASPSHGWVEASRFGFQLPVLDAPPRGAVLTIGPRSVPDARPGDVVLAYRRGTAGFRWVPLNALLNAKGLRAVAGVASGKASCRLARAALVGKAPSLISAKARGVTRTAGELRSYGYPGALAFTDAFDANWHLAIDGRIVPANLHFRADGWGNGWIVDVPAGNHRFEIWYAGARRYNALLVLEACVWAVVLMLLTIPRRVLEWRR